MGSRARNTREDPFLNGEYVMHWSRGMQEGEQEKYLKVVSTAKHFADYDQEGNGVLIVELSMLL